MERHPLMDDDGAARAPLAKGIPHEFFARVVGVREYTHKTEAGDVETLGIVFGWAMVCAEDGVDYFDTQDDHIPEASMLKASADFMVHSRVLGDMHRSAEGGSVVFAFPLTADIAAAMSITSKTMGLMIGVKPANPETLEKFKSGEYTGFSIGGRRLVDEEVA